MPADIDQAFLRSLSFPEMDRRYHSVDPAVANTCQWFLDHEHYKEWESISSHAASRRLLWLRGKPGSGKSTIMKRALSDAESKQAANMDQDGRPTLVTSFFFNTRGAPIESTTEGFFRTILVQMFEHENLELNCEPLKTFVRKHCLWGSNLKWTLAELRSMFQLAIRRAIFDVVLFIDALDECDPATSKELVDFLCEELDRVDHGQASLKFCISSRHYPNIHKRDCHTIIAESHNHPDIMTYAQDKMQNIGYTSAMARLITKHSSGVFLWAVLAIRQLREAIDNGEPHSVILNILVSTPKDLKNVFENLLSSINEDEERSRGLLLLLFVLCAKRPLELPEVRLLLAFTTPFQSLEEYQKSPDSVSEDQLQRRVIKWSRGLIEVVPSPVRDSSIVQFIHASVKDFLLENSTLLIPHLLRHEEVLAIGNQELARSCFNILRFAGSDPVSKRYRLDYQKEYAFKHAEEAEAAGMSQAYIAEALNLTFLNAAHPKALPWGKSFIYSDWNPVTICCYHELVSVIEALPRPFTPWKVEALGLKQALTIAIRNGCEASVHALVSAGMSLDWKDDNYAHPVYSAVVSGQVNTLRLLLRLGANPDGTGKEGSALNRAAFQGHVELVSILLEHHAAIDLGDENYGYPLLTAVSEGHGKVVELLLSHGANITMSGRSYWSVRPLTETHPLEEASRWGAITILQDLLGAAARDAVPEQYYRDASLAAFSAGHRYCYAFIRVFAKRRRFVEFVQNTSYSADILPSPRKAFPTVSKAVITVDVKTMTGQRIMISIPAHRPGAELKRAVYENCLGLPMDQFCLIVRSNFRLITDHQRLFDAGIKNGSRVEQTFPFRTRYREEWEDDEVELERALRISAEMA